MNTKPDPYAVAVSRQEAHEVSERLLDILPKLASEGAQVGVGLAALGLAIRKIISGLPAHERATARDAVIAMLR